MSERENLIATINSLYPPDSEYVDTNRIGQELLAQAKREVIGWHNEPIEVLRRYASLCLQRDRRRTPPPY